ncbi:MAG: glycosyltransferase family 39 protein [Armatimonadetes bacterium]|nr:glycosyltransferase family 39 protein [Armatimonadota bacterium]
MRKQKSVRAQKPAQAGGAGGLAIDGLAVAALCVICFLWRLGVPSLFDFNEGLYVQAAREMLLRGDLVTASVNGIWFYDKPPLALWLVVACFKLFGVTEWAARLPVALAACGLTCLTWAVARRWFGRSAALVAAAALALSPIFIGTARQMTMDIHQALWVAVSVLMFWQCERSSGRRSLVWAMGAWTAMGLAVLAKSVPGFVPLPCVAVWLVWEHQGRPRDILRGIARTRPWFGIPLLLAVILPWHLLAYRAHGQEFWYQYWTHHHVGILTGQEFSHAQPFWYYAPALLASMLPWSFLLPGAIKHGFTGSAGEPGAASLRRLAAVWCVLTVILFSLMRSKLVSYLLPMYPAAAILIGEYAAASLSATRRRGYLIGMACAATVLLAASVAGIVVLTRSASAATDPEAQALLSPGMVAYGRAAAAVLGATGLGMIISLALRAPRMAVGMCAAGMAGFIITTFGPGIGAYQASVNAPLHAATARAAKAAAEGRPVAIYIGRPRRPSVHFYLPSGLYRGPLPPQDAPYLVEASEAAPLARFAAMAPTGAILADSHRLPELEKLLGYSLPVEYGAGRWRLVSTRPKPKP